MARLRQYIKDNEFAPGAKLPSERRLARGLGVSRNSLREALRVLESHGIITVRQGQGTFVSSINLDKVDRSLDLQTITYDSGTLLELHEVREMIEVQAVRLATVRCTEDELAEMKDIIDRTRSKLQEGEVVLEEDMSFHAAIIRATKNRVLMRPYSAVTDLLYEVRKAGIIVSEGETMVAEAHEKILTAMKQGDSDAAAAAMRDHLHRVRDDVVRVFDVHKQKVKT